MFFFFNDTATTEIYTLSLHDALPISGLSRAVALLGPPPWPVLRRAVALVQSGPFCRRAATARPGDSRRRPGHGTRRCTCAGDAAQRRARERLRVRVAPRRAARSQRAEPGGHRVPCDCGRDRAPLWGRGRQRGEAFSERRMRVLVDTGTMDCRNM